MKYLVLISSLLLVACSNEPKESDKLLSDYKKQHLDKAKQVEAEMNRRVDNLNKQLEAIEKEKKEKEEVKP